MTMATLRHRPPLARVGPVLVFAFLLEVLAARGTIASLSMGLAPHLLLTSALLAALWIAGELAPSEAAPGWNALRLRTGWANTSVGLLIIWGLLSAVAQDALPAANLAFFALWALTYIVAFRSMPRLLAWAPPRQRLDLLSAALAIAVVGSLFVHKTLDERFAGFFGNATWSGLFLATATVHWGVRAASSRSRVWLWLLAFGVTAMLLVMTRTRAAIASAAIGLVFGLAQQLSAATGATAARARRVVMGAAYGLALLLLIAATGSGRPLVAGAARQLRLERGAQALYDSRGPVWERGLRDFGHNGVFGQGFLSKYGGVGRTRVIWGVEVPSYDWTTTNDPLNSLLLADQQLGLVGAVLFLALLMGIWRAGTHGPRELRGQFVGFFFVGLITAFANGNWLLSFGDSFDRFSYIALAALAFAPAAAAVRRDDSAEGTLAQADV